MKIPSFDNHRGLYNSLKIVLPYLVIVGLFQLVSYYLSGYDYLNSAKTPKTSLQTFITTLATLLATFVTVLLFKKKLGRNFFINIGFQNIAVKKNLLLGIVLGFIIMLTGFLTLLLTNEISIQSINFDLTELLLNMGIFIFVAIGEEVLCRGYILNNLMKSYNKYIALIVSSLFFSLLHLGNHFISILNLFDLFIAGILLGITYIHTKRLWFPIALHFSWNFFQGTIFGFNVSGNDHYSLLHISYPSPNLWNGGGFGFEGSLLSLLFQIIAICLIFEYYKKKNIKSNNVSITIPK
jgi:hypothetical protein